MSTAQFELLAEMFLMQWDHATNTLIATWESKGEAAARMQLQQEVNNRIELLDVSTNATGNYEFIDAIVLPSLLLAGLFLDLRLAGIEIRRTPNGAFELVDTESAQ